ncbi:hypothetical protein GCM10009122_28260 [Fulvivirga kasyanovii]|uniref:STAS/SEC14 domain-containing protein n=1 Tax=Fulvivirga kasyanovii TaxID=396812 RepID=A0ABW9RQ38_9BACT|nr:hypothetical protein [Fulvivirga kasyanovii]MTI26274.1 hypothetical protein [Fulvivirga kasyanovii]
MASCNVVKYKELDIVYTDISNASPEEAMVVFDENQLIISKMPLKSVYALVNAKDARFNSSLIQKIKETVKKNNPHSKATAVCGLNALSRLMVNSIIAFTGRQMKLVETEEEGKDWLYKKYQEAAVVV